MLIQGQKAPYHCTTFSQRKKMQQAIENLFYWYASLLEKRSFTKYNEVFVDETKLGITISVGIVNLSESRPLIPLYVTEVV